MTWIVIFSNKACFLQVLSQNRPLILVGNLVNGLYSTKNKVTDVLNDHIQLCTAAKLNTVDQTKLWHLRFGHLPFNQLSYVALITSVKECMKSTVCQICPAARQTRQPFHVSPYKDNWCFSIAHIDIWGPYKSISGCTQFLTIVDDFTRFTWIHLMKFKSEFCGILKNFLVFVWNQFNAKVLCIRSDNALKMSVGITKLLYDKFGIVHQTTCAYTP